MVKLANKGESTSKLYLVKCYIYLVSCRKALNNFISPTFSIWGVVELIIDKMKYGNGIHSRARPTINFLLVLNFLSPSNQVTHAKIRWRWVIFVGKAFKHFKYF